MNYFDEAKSILGMLKMRKMTQSELAGLLGVSQPYIANKLRLLSFSEDIRDKIVSAGLTERHARTLLRLKEDELPPALEKIISGKMTTAQTEILVDGIVDARREPEEYEFDSAADRLFSLEESIERALVGFRRFGVAARSKRENFGGKIYINICIG